MNVLLTETDKIKFREYLKVVLSAGVHEVVFEKKNGEIRVLKATRDPRSILTEYTSGTRQIAESTDKLSVYDTTSKSWKSFSFSGLIGVDGININTLLTKAQIIIEG